MLFEFPRLNYSLMEVKTMYLLKRLVMMALLASVFVPLKGCRQPPMPANSPLSTPGQDQSLVSPQPIPTFAVLPTPPSANVATVGGTLVRNLPSGSEPLADVKILLANVIRSEDGTPMVAAASEETSPMIVTGKDGSFIFTNVAPDTYGIAIVTPIGSFLIQDEKGDDFLFTVQAGMILDLGEIRTTLPY